MSDKLQLVDHKLKLVGQENRDAGANASQRRRVILLTTG